MSGHQDPIVSTGRGGAGNIGTDPVKYEDAGMKREGFVGESPEGDYSAGRGGAGNIVPSPRVGPQAGRRGSQDKIPEANLQDGKEGNFHVGRGGEGNVHHDKKDGKPKESLMDKAKNILHSDKK